MFQPHLPIIRMLARVVFLERWERAFDGGDRSWDLVPSAVTDPPPRFALGCFFPAPCGLLPTFPVCQTRTCVNKASACFLSWLSAACPQLPAAGSPPVCSWAQPRELGVHSHPLCCPPVYGRALEKLDKISCSDARSSGCQVRGTPSTASLTHGEELMETPGSWWEEIP